VATSNGQGKGQQLAIALLICAGTLAILLLVPTVFEAVRGRLFADEAATLQGFRLLLVLRHALLVANGIALLVFIVGLWQRKTWAFLGIGIVAAICLALMIGQFVVVGFRPGAAYPSLVALVSIASVILWNMPTLRAHVGAKPVNHLQEALKWVAAVAIVLASVAFVSGIYVSRASALLRVQPYEALTPTARGNTANRCSWLTTPRVCLPTRYSVRQSATGPIVQRSSADDAIMFISSDNVWATLAATFGFDSAYSLQSTLWDTAYFPLLYAALKQAMYTQGMSVYRLDSDRVRSLIQLQQRDGTWQVSATIYLPDGTSFELVSAHRNKQAALHPIVIAINAY
jgi:hypothetical protein